MTTSRKGGAAVRGLQRLLARFQLFVFVGLRDASCLRRLPALAALYLFVGVLSVVTLITFAVLWLRSEGHHE